ncbi:MAG: gluconokinase [Nitrospirae bacterium]|nr:gluconokinase [Nitrospirota bacterium]
MVYVVMGVSGSGKTTVGKMLSDRLDIDFYDADDFHSLSSLDKMKNSIPLKDEDRMPWLLNLARNIRDWNKGRGAVIACSALKEEYRRMLSGDGNAKVVFIYLEGDKSFISARMKARREHFFQEPLLESQFEALEPPVNAITMKIDAPPSEICDGILNKLAGLG